MHIIYTLLAQGEVRHEVVAALPFFFRKDQNHPISLQSAVVKACY